jgi:LAO/AO transport system kinase
VDELLRKVLQGNVRATGRLISAVENDSALAQTAISALYKYTGKAYTVGVTGPPGCGKSTLVNELTKKLIDRGRSVGVIAVDPTSPFTGGALLGDRVRMADIATLDNVFVRSMASRGMLGGLAQATSAVIKILDAAGYDVILIETVGAGQAEVEIASVAHTVLVIEAPGSGDEIQSNKAGILEIADILVVNKADRPSALNTVRALETMLHLGQPASGRHHGRYPDTAVIGAKPHAQAGWQVPVLQTIAVKNQGIEKLLDHIMEHRWYLQESGQLFERERLSSRREIERLLNNLLLLRVQRVLPSEQRENLIAAVARRELDPYTAADQLYAMQNEG